MTIGLITGCYSSIAIATPLYAIWKTREDKFAKLSKKYGPEVQRFFLNKLPVGKVAAAGAGNVGETPVVAGDAVVVSEKPAISSGTAASKAGKASSSKKKNNHKKKGH